MAQYIFTIRKQHSVNKVHTLRYSVSKISEYKSRCCGFLLFCYILCRKSWYLVQCMVWHLKVNMFYPKNCFPIV